MKSSILKLFYTIKPSVYIELSEPSRHKILHCNQSDLDIFIDSRVKTLGTTFRDSVKENIKSQLRTQVENPFLWLKIIIRKIGLINMSIMSTIEETIRNISDELDSLYYLLTLVSTAKVTWLIPQLSVELLLSWTKSPSMIMSTIFNRLRNSAKAAFPANYRPKKKILSEEIHNF